MNENRDVKCARERETAKGELLRKMRGECKLLLSIRRKIVCVSAKKNKVYWHKVKGYNRFTALPIYDANSTRLYQV